MFLWESTFCEKGWIFQRSHLLRFADTMTDSMKAAIEETKRRRQVQMEYNEKHGITPKTIHKSVRDLISISKKVSSEEMKLEKDPESMSEKELQAAIKDINKKMKKAAAELNFEVAAELRDQLIEFKKKLLEIEESKGQRKEEVRNGTQSRKEAVY